MEITILGSGTSQGVPVIGCHCPVCTSPDPKDNRLRTSALVSILGKSIVIDVGPDFRQQMLRAVPESLDIVLITHEHNDHIIGLDDIRPFYFRQKKGIEYFATSRVISEIKTRFPYAFEEKRYPGAPKVDLNEIKPLEPILLNFCEILPVPVRHGQLDILGYRIGKFAYITDASYLPEQTMDALKGLDVLILNALRKEKHYSHYNLEEAMEIAERLSARKTYLTHISHLMGKHAEIESLLPENIHLAYDGLKIYLPDSGNI